jgi:2-dehydro-3-deoxyphosphogluconate aldolase/(4S)-4-hydroxy-2-oxoglutarate aldolase
VSETAVREALESMRVIPVLRLGTREAAAAAIDCLIEADFKTVELTLTTPDAIGLIGALKEHARPGFLVGAGTVLDLNRAQECLDAGADYLVSPCLVPGMAELTRARGAAVLMGAFTPTEVLAAWRDGAQIVKLFPAASGGPAHLAAIHAVYPEIPLCPTGGVSTANMLDYFKAGACAVGVGNNIIDQKALAAGDRAQVIRHARSFVELARGA